MNDGRTFTGRKRLWVPRRVASLDHSEPVAVLPTNLVSFHGELLQEAPHAYLVGFGDTAVWVPMSLTVDVEAGGLHEPISMMLPQWFTELEGLD